MTPYLDKDFLYELNQYRHKEIYARIISLNYNEDPLETIEGKVTGGSINIDGNSAVRRTCNVSMIAKDVNIHSYYWNEANKFKLEIGVKNPFDKYQESYPIVWFKQGTYVITSFNSSLNINSYSISISGKDKMCMLNGDFGGNLPASVDFGCIDEYNSIYKAVTFENYQTEYKANKYYIQVSEGNNFKYELSSGQYDSGITYYEKETVLTQRDLTLEFIIRHAIHTYANEPYHNIIISDLSDYGLELIEYRGDKPIYAMYNNVQNQYTGLVANDEFEVKIKSNGNKIFIKDIERFNAGINIFNNSPTEVQLVNGTNEDVFTVTQIQYGDTIGYRQTDLVYLGELISSIGETLTSLLDKIKNMLGPFEYFYDLDGRFIFQAKKIYSNTSWNPITEADGNKFVRDAVEESQYSYSFEDINLISQFSSTPNLQNVKNDYSVWGVRKGVSGAEIPIHARYAIHSKPTYYKSLGNNGQGKYYGEALVSGEVNQAVRESVIYHTDKERAAADNELLVDWREIIYQMALDYYQHNEKPDFLYRVEQTNKIDGLSLYPLGTTTYEMFYIDMQGFWRQLYDINLPLYYPNVSGGEYKETRTDLEDGDYTITLKWTSVDQGAAECDYFKEGNLKYWHKNVLEAPDALNFWIDFYDADTEIFKYSINTIGDRTKVVNDNKIKSVYYRDIPQVVVYFPGEENDIEMQSGYTYFKLIDSMRNAFTISAQGKSANDEINNLMNQHSYYSESISVTAIPIYDLQPNTLIYMHNDENNINGKYSVDRITIPLTYNGTMSISATKIIDTTF